MFKQVYGNLMAGWRDLRKASHSYRLILPVLLGTGMFMAEPQMLWAQTPNLDTSAPTTSFMGEQFCMVASLSNSGPPGFGIYLRLIIPPELTFDSANWLGIPSDVYDLGIFPASPALNQIQDPWTNEMITGPTDGHFYLIQPQVNLIQGQPPIDVNICMTISPDVALGVPLEFSTTPVYITPSRIYVTIIVTCAILRYYEARHA